MGKMLENPRYNIISLRLSDEEMREFEQYRDGTTRQAVLRSALLNYIKGAKDGK